MPLKNNIYTMSELKNRDEERQGNEENPIWIRAQIALMDEGIISPIPVSPGSSKL